MSIKVLNSSVNQIIDNDLDNQGLIPSKNGTFLFPVSSGVLTSLLSNVKTSCHNSWLLDVTFWSLRQSCFIVFRDVKLFSLLLGFVWDQIIPQQFLLYVLNVSCVCCRKTQEELEVVWRAATSEDLRIKEKLKQANFLSDRESALLLSHNRTFT